MQNFGKQQSANINMVGELLQELFATLKKLVDGQMSLNGLMMQMFGRNMEQLLEQISPALAGLWKGLAINIETAYAGGSNTLSNFGKVVDNNFAYGTNAAGGFWSTIQSAVDSTINSTLNAASHGRIPRN
jgi:phage-related protein